MHVFLRWKEQINLFYHNRALSYSGRALNIGQSYWYFLPMQNRVVNDDPRETNDKRKEISFFFASFQSFIK